MEFVTTDGATLAYETAGDGEPVLLIHGALIADSFKPLFTSTSLPESYELITFHRRGYGGSRESTGHVPMARQAADCLDLLHKLGVNRAHVAGHSYGGSIGLQMALDSPETVASLALLEPALVIGDAGKGYRESLERGQQLYGEIETEMLVDQFLGMRFGQNYREPLEQAVPGAFEQSVLDAGTAIDFDLAALLEWTFGKEEADRVIQPVLSAYGANSLALNPRFAETHNTLLKWLDDVDEFVVPGAAHGLQMQNAGGMADGLRAFWERHVIAS